MSIGSNWAVEIAEDEYRERKANWIRAKLGDPKADESSPGWDELEAEYEELGSHDEEIYDSTDDEDLYQYYLDNDYFGDKSRSDIFQETVSNVRKLLEISINSDLKQNLIIMIYAHTVAAIEGYLELTFVDAIREEESARRKLIETDPFFANQTITRREIFSKFESLKEDLTKYVKELIFHDLKKIKPMYKSVLNIEFGDIGWLFRAVVNRHHCVHRAGLDKDGNTISITEVDVKELMEKCEKFIQDIERQKT